MSRISESIQFTSDYHRVKIYFVDSQFVVTIPNTVTNTHQHKMDIEEEEYEVQRILDHRESPNGSVSTF